MVSRGARSISIARRLPSRRPARDASGATRRRGPSCAGGLVPLSVGRSGRPATVTTLGSLLAQVFDHGGGEGGAVELEEAGKQVGVGSAVELGGLLLPEVVAAPS